MSLEVGSVMEICDDRPRSIPVRRNQHQWSKIAIVDGVAAFSSACQMGKSWLETGEVSDFSWPRSIGLVDKCNMATKMKDS